MTQVIGFDAKETIRIGTNGSRYSYPLGVSVEVFDFNKFKEQYEQAIKAKVKDPEGAESDWGTLEFTAPKLRLRDSNLRNILEKLNLFNNILNRLGFLK